MIPVCIRRNSLLPTKTNDTLTIFISQPLFDALNGTIYKTREMYKQFLKHKYKDKNIVIINDFIMLPKNADEFIKALNCASSLIPESDLVYFCKNWKSDIRCKIELRIAIEAGIDVESDDGIPTLDYEEIRW